MKTFASGVVGMGLKIRLDTKGIHLIKPGVIGSKDDFYLYGGSLTSSTSLVGITTINFLHYKLKGFTKEQAKEIEKIFGYGANHQYLELIDCVGIDGQEYEDSPEYKLAIEQLKANWLQKKADQAAKDATEALNAQALAAEAASNAAKAFNRHQQAASKAVQSASINAIQNIATTVQTQGIYLAIDGQQQGPYNLDELMMLVQQGSVNCETMVWKEGLSTWVPAGQLPELKSLFTASQMPPVPPTIPSSH